MADWPMEGGGNWSEAAHGNPVAGSSYAKGAWVEVFAATLLPCSFISCIIGGSTGYNLNFLIDIAVGAAGSEVVVCENLHYGGPTWTGVSYWSQFSLPLNIPKGSRISVRCSSTTNAAQAAVHLMLFSNTFLFQRGVNKIISLGEGADAMGTTIDPGATANTYGSWVELSSGEDYTIKGISLGIVYDKNISRNSMLKFYQVGIGSSGSEQSVFESTGLYYGNSSAASPIVSLGFMPIIIPKGTRVAVRGKCTITDATDRKTDVIIHAMI